MSNTSFPPAMVEAKNRLSMIEQELIAIDNKIRSIMEKQLNGSTTNADMKLYHELKDISKDISKVINTN